MRKLALLVLIALSLPAGGRGAGGDGLPVKAQPPTGARPDDVDTFLRSQMEKRHIPGFQVAVIRGGKVVKLGAYGLANVQDSVPVDDRTLFQTNSITKAFTGVAVMQLLSEISRDASRAVLAVTHDPRTVPFANRVLRIEDGLIVGEERRAEGVETVHQLARNRKRKANA